MSLVLESRVCGDFKPHVEGIHPSVCVDVIDLGMVETEFQGERRIAHKVRVVFETEQKGDEGRNCTVTKTFTASLHPKAKLAEFLGKWRGRPVVPGESIDLAKLIGACCTLVISHQQNLVGRTYASIDAVSKPTKRLVPSGQYDPALARQRIAEAKAKEAGQARGGTSGHLSPPLSPRGGEGVRPVPQPMASPAQPPPPPKSTAPVSAPAAPDFDPEVGF